MSKFNASNFKNTNSKIKSSICLSVILGFAGALLAPAQAQTDSLPIADVHIHYSHDSVELTPPERVIEIMREANLKFALVSSSDDNGTQLLSELAPDLIVPGLRPYRRRGETGTWFKDPEALEYVELLLANNQYASIGEFHLYGSDAELPIPKRIVELAEEFNLILHAHSDADAVERLLAQSDSVKVIWAHSGFDAPEEISALLSKHDRLWADLAFRGEVGSGGLSDAWRKLFEDHPTRMMLGTDTYTPERMYFIPDHAAGARTWLETLPEELAENVSWRNGYNLIMPIWEANKKSVTTNTQQAVKTVETCEVENNDNAVLLEGERYKVLLKTDAALEVSKPGKINAIVCGDVSTISEFKLDASMPAHGHGTNYTPTVSITNQTDNTINYAVDGVVLHMPGNWQWDVEILDSEGSEALEQAFMIK